MKFLKKKSTLTWLHKFAHPKAFRLCGYESWHVLTCSIFTFYLAKALDLLEISTSCAQPSSGHLADLPLDLDLDSKTLILSL